MDVLNPTQDDICRGVNFRIRYVGCIRLACSMRTLQFASRTAIAKECIYRVCRAANLVNADKTHKIDPLISGLESELDTPDVSKSGGDVELVMSSRNFSTSSADSGIVLMTHPLPNISFASGGDQETCEFFCYVVKNDAGRYVHVFEVDSYKLAKVLQTIQLAFSFRTQAAQPATQTQVPDLSSPISDNAINMSFAKRLSVEEQLSMEKFYHGAIPREQTEKLLQNDGQFLVRKSQTGALPNGMPQFVLSGMQKGIPRHLLLLSDDNVVRTRDRQFESVSHLIQYHMENSLPIVSQESSLVLKTPIFNDA